MKSEVKQHMNRAAGGQRRLRAIVWPAALLGAALLLVSSAPAGATGNVRIQQGNGSVKTYPGVTFKVAKRSLTLTSADKVSTVVISGATCVPNADIIRCTGGGFTLLQDGARHRIPFKAATFYFNLNDQDRSLPLSTTKIGAHSVVFAVETAKGLDITGSGRLDEEPTP
jgi:hypothetical protein